MMFHLHVQKTPITAEETVSNFARKCVVLVQELEQRSSLLTIQDKGSALIGVHVQRC